MLAFWQEISLLQLRASAGLDSNSSPASAETADRLAAMETRIEQLQKTLTSLDMEKVSRDREKLFRSEFGYEKADEFLELGSFAVAGNGYLQFLESYPDHPDARDIMTKAREAYLKAGYQDKARWVQDQIMERFPENIAKDAYKMALMLKQEGRYDEALDYVNAAAQAASNDIERLWRLQYGAYLVEQRDGNAAGAAAYREVLSQIEAANLSEDSLGTTTRERIADLESRTSQRGS